ncbi:MAG TPA: TetR/AcrR family transcriptional regulator [Mycobacteriales bacterium]|nr:TetR/AcrR family transcriptional regulator [Mycobacteriales bacterium]
MSSSPGVGRPRHAPEQRPGATGREQILDAAGELFTRFGYAGTSTRMIAMAVGIKQASLYYHFASKDDILSGLLQGTVQPSLDVARRLARAKQPPELQLYALTLFDVRALVADRWNLGSLQLQPELRDERYAEFHREREALRRAYGRPIAEGVAVGTLTLPTATVADATALVFAFVESVIAMRSDDLLPARDDMGHVMAAGVLRMLGCAERTIASTARAADELLAALS